MFLASIPQSVGLLTPLTSVVSPLVGDFGPRACAGYPVGGAGTCPLVVGAGFCPSGGQVCVKECLELAV